MDPCNFFQSNYVEIGKIVAMADEILELKTPSPRERALDGAVRCFTEQGVRKTNMADVASASGMARSTLYRHFSDRDELIIAVMEREAVTMAAEIAADLQAHTNFRTFVVEGLLMAIDVIEANATLGSLFVGESAADASRLLLMTNRLRGVGLDVVKPMIRSARQAGELRATLDPEMMMDWILRILLSLLTVPSDLAETREQKRVLLETMLLPALINC
jgi:AcrR family transcriptional regulator